MSKSGPLALAAPSWFGCASGGLSYLGTRTSWERGDKETGAGQRPQTADGRGREHDGRGTERPGGATDTPTHPEARRGDEGGRELGEGWACRSPNRARSLRRPTAGVNAVLARHQPAEL
jgi:hypothetical protein